MRVMVLFIVLGAWLVTTPGGAPGAMAQDDQGPYLFHLMKKPAYRRAWSDMTKGETVPLWISKFGVSYNATGAPTTEVPVEGEPHTLAWICEPQNCGDNEIYVLFAPEGRQAWALLVSDGTKQQWLGNPNDVVKAAIESNVQ